MEKEIKQIETAVKHFFVHDSFEKSGIRPAKDWIIILPVFFCGLVVAGLLAVYINIHVQEGTLWTASVTDQSPRVYQINQKNLDIVTNLFAQKKSNIDQIVSGSKIVPDPSL